MNKLALVFASLVIFFLFSCKKDSEKGEPDLPFKIQLILDTGDTLVIDESGFSSNSYGRAGGVIDTLGNHVEIQSTSYNFPVKVSVNFIKKFPSQPDSSQIENIFHTGSYPFGNSDIDSLADGVEITMIDFDSKKWSTAFGSQDSSAFLVTEHKKNDFDDFTPYMTSGNFNCTLYDSLGNTIVFTSGTFTGRTVVYP